MQIHIVQPGETAESIANLYGLPVERLIIENAIIYPNNLVVGDTIVILYPEITYTVQEGDTLAGIAEAYGVTVMDLLRNNPYLSDREYLTPGETIVIQYADPKIKKIAVNGYAYPFIENSILRKTLPFLTYLNIYSYAATPEGNLININDTEVIRTAKEYGVAPIMLITFPESENRENDITHRILTNKEVQSRYVNDVLHFLNTKGYYGVNFDIVYIFPEDRQLYIEFMVNFVSVIREQGYQVFNTYGASTFELLTGIAYSELQYANISDYVDFTILLPYELGFSIGIPLSTITFNTVQQFIDIAITLIPPEKLQIGLSTIGYIWELPFLECISRGNAISNTAAVELARENNVPIEYDVSTESAYFIFIQGNEEFFVQFKDARTINAYVQEVAKTGLGGIAVWNVMNFFNDLWLIVNSQFEIDKVIM
ncbi:LysM peptidoglycan-binding domain-containing protein [Anaerocolumna aminovalerica]|uniref:LysM peptidoglycan-binding domain-containing protein n=1 Tax=Anaerocolumna aminovalerica TaxID=1527 RepID=UPI000BE2AEF0|nr:LysM peptidoglycan-binding domain-containing protein [Anaerocolumna aminovalerica]